jgi:hypothetical protein
MKPDMARWAMRRTVPPRYIALFRVTPDGGAPLAPHHRPVPCSLFSTSGTELVAITEALDLGPVAAALHAAPAAAAV